jgi:hypothetical protein
LNFPVAMNGLARHWRPRQTGFPARHPAAHSTDRPSRARLRDLLSYR